MKRILLYFFVLCCGFSYSQITYTFTALGGAYTANSAPTILHGGNVDSGVSPATGIGFSFCFGGITYTTFQATSNGVLFLGTTTAGSNNFNDLNTSADRRAIAPLWDDLETDAGGNVNYQLTGVSPNRILTVEWSNMLWNWLATNPSISFQAKLYETTNVIDFVYTRVGGGGATGNLNSASASIGISGSLSGDFYSLNGTGATPAASKVTETNNLASKPANGQIYRWTPAVCSGVPLAGVAASGPPSSCGTFTSNLSFSGGTAACGITYQWQSGPSATGPWTNIAGATSPTVNVTNTATTYYQIISSCGASSIASTPASAVVIPVGPCALCNITNIAALPYNITGATNCGLGNNVTSSNVSNVCGSTNYYGGEDAVYSFTPTVTGQISINATSAGSWLGLMLYNGCPVSGGTCVGNSQSSAGSQSLCVNVTAGQVYYIIIDSYPSPNCNTFNLSISGCTGSPLAGNSVASPNIRCAAYTTTLSLSGSSSNCGLTYQWQTGPSATGPWSNITGATAATATFAVTAPNTYFQCILSCSTFSSSSAVASTTITAAGVCGLCGVTPITLPYSANAQTTCGSVNDLTAAMVTNACGSTNYLGGEDVIYTFTPTTSGQISVTFSTSGSSAGAMLYQGCPNSGGTCSGNVTGTSSFSGNQTFCANVTAGLPYFLIIDSWPSPTCNGYNINITVPTGAVNACSISSYAASSVGYTFETFAGTNAPSTDDVLFNNTINFGFPFCFGGNQFNTGYIASNGAIVFDAVSCFPNIQTTTYAAPGVWTGYTITAPAPVNNTSVPRNAILGPWHDIDPSLGGLIEYATLGVAPNRRFVVSYDQIPMYSCGVAAGSGQFFSGQIKIYETSGNIEIHIRNKQLCSSWNGGDAIMGLHNFDGTIYVPPVNATAHNFPTNWTMTNTGYQWTSACSNCAVLPIEFKAFYGERIDKVNKLFWETSLEKDVLSYSLMRSIDAENFTEISKVDANNTASTYNYNDININPGALYYYKVISNEKNGGHKSTNTIPLGADLNEVMVSGIYPNPVQSDFVISVDSRTATELEIKIYDLVGKLVKSFTRNSAIGVQQLNFSVPELPAGSYMIEVRSNNKQVITQQKLIKVD
jgi:hypothetical protein